MAEDAVEHLYSSDDSKVVQALKIMGSLALDEPENVVAAGGVGSMCELLSRTGLGSGVILQEATVALYLLLEEQDPDAQAAFDQAHGRSRLQMLLSRPGVPEEALSWARQILEMLPSPAVPEESEAHKGRHRTPEQIEDRDGEGQCACHNDERTELISIGSYRVMRRAVARREMALDSKRGVTLHAGTVVRPVHRCIDPSGVVTRFQLDDSYQSCWVSEHGLDGTTILEPIDADGRTPSEVLAAKKEQLAQEKQEAKQRALEEEAARKKRFHDGLAQQRKEMDALQSSFVSMRSTLAELQGERKSATEKILASSAALKAAAQGVSDAQEELEKAEERKRDAELDIILTLRAIPGSGTGMTADLDKHARGGKIVTVSQKRFIPAVSYSQVDEPDVAMTIIEPEPESQPKQRMETDMVSDGDVASALQQADAARYDRLAGLAHGPDTMKDMYPSIGDDTQSLAVDGLKVAPFVVLDNFVGIDLCTALRKEIQCLDEEGHLKEGELGGGRTGANLTYYNSKVRGDRVGWFDGDEPTLSLENLARYLSAVDSLVGNVGDTLEELLDRQIERSSAMITCYPGGGSRYIRHIDNPNKNGRLITAIYYMNTDWQPEHGGTLRIYNPAVARPNAAESESGSDVAARKAQEAAEPPRVEIEPIGDRLLLFFSDTRCPHEVMPSHHYRYAVTTWYSCAKERVAAVQRAAAQAALGGDQQEEARLQMERDRFAAETTTK